MNWVWFTAYPAILVLVGWRVYLWGYWKGFHDGQLHDELSKPHIPQQEGV